MPCSGPEIGAASLKWLSYCPSNPCRGLPVIHALVILADAETGAPLGRPRRVGSDRDPDGGGLGRGHGRPGPDRKPSTAAIFGAGIQARSQLAAVLAVRGDRARPGLRRPSRRGLGVRGRNDGRARDRGQGGGISLRRRSPGADIVCTATTATEPVFDDRDIGPGTHINAVGVFDRLYAEIPAGDRRPGPGDRGPGRSRPRRGGRSSPAAAAGRDRPEPLPRSSSATSCPDGPKAAAARTRSPSSSRSARPSRTSTPPSGPSRTPAASAWARRLRPR